MADAPILVLSATPLGDRKILGLSLHRRWALAARRGGFREVLLLGGGTSAPSEMATVPTWVDVAASLPPGEASPLLVAAANVLAETDWLTRLAEPDAADAAWAAAPGRVVRISGTQAARALSALGEESAADLGEVEAVLARCLGPPVPLAEGIDPLLVAGPGNERAAERRLMQKLVKDTDGFMARHVERPISLQISRLLAPTAITPNQMSLISIAIGISAGPFFLSSGPLMQTIGALLFLAHSILDGCDGELARLKFQQSRLGGMLDFWGDNVVHVVIFACMAVGWSLSAGAGWPLLLGVGAVLGTLGSAGFVYWRLMREKDGGGSFASVSAEPERPLAKALDAASRRDFIYLVVLLALFGRSNWFVLLAGIGAPIYCLMLVFLALREERSDGKARAAGGA